MKVGETREHRRLWSRARGSVTLEASTGQNKIFMAPLKDRGQICQIRFLKIVAEKQSLSTQGLRPAL